MVPTLALTGLTLRVQDLERQLAFYRGLLGLEVLYQQGPETTLAPTGGKFTLTLLHAPNAPLRPQPTLGLYHLALLLPSRAALAAIFRRLVEARYPHFQGASDHGVSEALYLADLEGNGLELYRDRPREDWPFRGGRLAMVSMPLDLQALLAEAKRSEPLDPETALGHLHLHVRDLDEAQAFYQGLGLQLMQGDYPGARFLAADGYHHHIGINLWARGRTAPKDATGLLSYQIAIQGQAPQTQTDPNGTQVRITTL
ncbi:VOC family protein [Meiothermus hypogaeus]|uniref:Glyoxalase n=2 Tax=Meiothermus hypogaeus TaxID=884155 RepID=A0A511R229_9DEIN|nr:VOC family protein [Meiothermus hypogaeus]RIH76611.1 Catechol-2,3-dioxygenase [Meiothermus hypogaeus]GEM83367.1 glyoxalase [Meiothermus hypogaeus NBRC 106114]